ncbi:hydroxyacid dehydrogenase [archaeon]|jgi:D-3-phosphoglycerate dehydrogenase|nr:hydroxyacid dehydrogenase [archaeon]MBT4272866.1 hydroxyacid dehydrogenase [archaeon]MBT4461666.1 hydroxyacid dehydrogenase [archaeon]MBT5423013.1 hydroxyacid dehydrogenase [archaeon]MBT6773137.1 hydroxyacid dehydrogenase [archaeon]
MKITLLEPIGASINNVDEFKAELENNGHELVTYDSRPTNDEEIIKRSSDSDIIVLTNFKISANVINNCPNLKMISVAFTGFDHIDLKTCNEKNIVVCNAAGYSTDSVAELSIGLMISVLRKIVWGDKKVRELSTRERFLGTELKGKTVGVIGTGTIGLAAIKLLEAFGCKVIAFSRTKKPGINYLELDELLSQSDIVTLHVPLNEKTNKMINENNLKLMKPSSIIINTARGAVIDNDALADALINKTIAGAGLDTVDMEPPLPENYKLLSAPNTVIMPHIGYATKEAMRIRTNIVFENITKFLNNDVQNQVN